MEVTVPNKDRPEWRQMISGEININYSNYVLQMQLTQIRKSVELNECSKQEAVEKIYSLCSKYALAVQNDLKQIFKTW